MKTEINVPEGKEILAFTPSYELILLKQGRHNVNVISIQTPHDSQGIFIIRTIIQEQFNIANKFANSRLGKRGLNKTLSKLIHNLTQDKYEIRKVYQNNLNKENLETYGEEDYKPIYSLRDGILPLKAISDLEKDPVKTDYVLLEEGKQILTLIEFLYKKFVQDKTAFKKSENGEYNQDIVSYNALVLFNIQSISDLLVPLLVLETENSKMTSYYESYQRKVEEVNEAIQEYIEENYYVEEKQEGFFEKLKNKII